MHVIAHETKRQHGYAMSQRTHRNTVHPENVIGPVLENHILRKPVCTDMPVVFHKYLFYSLSFSV